MDILPAGPEGSNPEVMASTSQAVGILAVSIALLPDRQRLLILMRYQDELNLRQIAAEWGFSEPAVHAMHGRAITNLRRQLAELRIRCLSDLL